MAFTIPTGLIQSAGGGGGTSILDNAMKILNSPGGAALISAGGAGLSAYGANKSAEADRAATAQQFAANMAQRQLEADRDHQQGGAVAAANASPLGAEQNFAQKQAIIGAILGNSKNFSATPGDPRVAAAMGSTNQGGIRLPEGGFNPAMLDRLYGDKATMESIANRQQAVGQINPRHTPLNLGTMYGDAGTAATGGVVDANTAELQRQEAETARQRQIIMQAIDEDIRGNKQGKSGGSKAKGALGGAASGALAGASFGPWGAAIGGGIGLLKGLF